jgi:hypothetical protein
MNEITTLREIRPAPPPTELDAIRLAARARFVAGTVPKRTRQRWRLPVLAGGLTAAAAVTASGALVLTSAPVAMPAQHAKAGHTGTVVTTAWTVHEDADGTVTIYLRQYADPAGLQRTLRADGINALVRPIPHTLRTLVIPGFGHQQKKNAGAHDAGRVAMPTCAYANTGNEPGPVEHAVVRIVKETTPAYFIIDPAKMPQGSALFLAFMPDMPAKTGGTSNWAMKPVVLRKATVPDCVPVRWASKPAPSPNPMPKFTVKAAPPTIAPKAP